jgi:hypothetical protein
VEQRLADPVGHRGEDAVSAPTPQPRSPQS